MEEMESPTEGLQDKINEMAEEEKQLRSNELNTVYVALSTAIIAVFAAIAGLLSGDHANKALILQVKASDQWNYYQAKTIKYELAEATEKIISSSTSGTHASSGSHHSILHTRHGKGKHVQNTEPVAASTDSTAAAAATGDTAAANKLAHYTKQKAEIQKQAEDLDKQSEEHLHRHEILSRAVTLFQIAIAISAISILTRKRYLWWASIGLCGIGVVFLIQGLI